jgi:hypothetical protein
MFTYLALSAPSEEALPSTSSLQSPTIHYQLTSDPIDAQRDVPTAAQLALPLQVFAAHVAASEFQQAEAAEQAAARAASARAAQAAPTSTAPSTATTSQPTPSGSNGTIWACIISHESRGDPTAVNASSGAGGLFQFEPATWLANGGTGLPEDASVATQWAIATATQARDGWSPWIGDGCTPLG